MGLERMTARPPEGTRWTALECAEQLGIEPESWRQYGYRGAPEPVPGTDPPVWDAVAVWDWRAGRKAVWGRPRKPPTGPGMVLSATQARGAALVFGGPEVRGARFVEPGRLVVDDLAAARAAVAAVVESAHSEELPSVRALARKLERVEE